MTSRNGKVARVGLIVTCVVIICTTCFAWGMTVGTVRQNKVDIRDMQECLSEVVTAVTILKTIQQQRAKGDTP